MIFVSGLPGAIDYIMLTFVKAGYINRLTEKYYNSLLNVWIRAPGLIFINGIAHVKLGMYIGNYNIGNITNITFAIAAINMFLNYWNGQYFMRRVLSNYSIESYRAIDKIR